MDFTPTPKNHPILRLSKERIAKLTALLLETLNERRTTRAKLQKLLGKLNFAHTAVLGKYASATLRPLYALTSMGTEASRLTINKEAATALRWWIRALQTAAPRFISRPCSRVDIRIYSDAEGSGGCAALLFHGKLPNPTLLKRRVGAQLVDELSASTSAIYILEMYAMVAAVTSVSARVPTNLLLFMDNDAAAQALIKGSASNEQALLLIKLFWNHVASNHLLVWIERVDSGANPADAPSRGLVVRPTPREIRPLSSFHSLINRAKTTLFQGL